MVPPEGNKYCIMSAADEDGELFSFLVDDDDPFDWLSQADIVNIAAICQMTIAKTRRK